MVWYTVTHSKDDIRGRHVQISIKILHIHNNHNKCTSGLMRYQLYEHFLMNSQNLEADALLYAVKIGIFKFLLFKFEIFKFGIALGSDPEQDSK